MVGARRWAATGSAPGPVARPVLELAGDLTRGVGDLGRRRPAWP